MPINHSPPPPSTVYSIRRSLSDIRTPPPDHRPFDNPRRFTAFAHRLSHLLLLPLPHSPPVNTALTGISGELSKASETVSVYNNGSKILVLINCKSLCSSLQDRSVSIGGWLSLLASALPDADDDDLRKKVSDLSRDMKLVQFRVTENEERVWCTLEKEGEGRETSKVVQSGIVMDLARALGFDPGDHAEFCNQVKFFKDDPFRSNSVSERRILLFLERILSNWSAEPATVTPNWDFEIVEDDVVAPVFPFKSFLCPLTKEVMRDPVVVMESFQSYERTAIEYWFDQCIQDGRDPTCPVTGAVLKSLELKPNIGLAGAIEEWVGRVVEHQIKSAVVYLSEEPLSVDHVECALDHVYKVSEEHPSSRYVIRNAGVVLLIVTVLSNNSKTIGSRLRSKALMTLLSMAKDEESRKIMLARGITKLAVNSLIGSSEKEREYAVKLLLEFCSDEDCCIRIASEKGALVLLSSIAGNLEYPSLSNLAEEVLRQMERVEDNVHCLAAAGRFEPLISRLHDSSDSVKIEMASLVGRMTLTNSCKEQIARQGARVFVELLSKPEGREPSLQALYNLSGLDDNATVLVESSVLPSLVEVLFDDQDPSYELKSLAASTIANIVSKPGRWELASADKNGNLMQSENIVFKLLELLNCLSSQCQVTVLRILCGITSSPQASELVASLIMSEGGFRVIIPFLQHPEVEHRVFAFKLTRLLSEWFSQDIANELRLSNKLMMLQEKMFDNQSTNDERSDAAQILANLSLSEGEVQTLLGDDFVAWTANTLKNQRRVSNARFSHTASGMQEGLIGLLLHITRNLDQQTLNIVRENRLMTIFCEQLDYTSKPKVKRLAAIGLKNLSEFGRSVTARDSESPSSSRFCSSLVLMCGRASSQPSTCPIHNRPCEEDSQLCLLKSNCVKPLVDTLNGNDTDVQLAAVDALSTLVSDYTSHSFKRVVDEFEKLGAIDSLITLSTEARSEKLQEKTIWIIEKILRVENLSNRHALNQSLVRGLVEAFKHGNTNTRKHAQDALTLLKQLSAVSGKTSSQTRAQR
ncbi:U-box domain-containing protein 44-like [Abrus precatorius]|uniref:RING-type E3 ubiquitin transferase n=1 Tax=Abrus precatorius TaxID=3816 RepID=A0A8B8JYP4_ABRPR|nr:U-box domain-containing protein 44-like [Abrus precatorius]